ncbi:DUF2268 domain-containing protein [Rhodococcus sp. HNM0563]|uniref:DUF2268 domain-containing protein n=1 Tax=unclassified Rhodococcus (in: high G+C Gram-positive bacteria) TaxID=192944 RepID=UPI00146A5087|nr:MULTISPECIES: DUF2268 domain-containing putative Zn-dependent protease [unclassified Rhodococcus (in: high G+C Gram-positive bacteria)]MCK0093004.1 DUF2268 domain-containing protein [Rhodococcus sp. F64268]NLU62647.1 DUF2268 domain-containing protein [Rhodococcus sp. HNM0563]
MTISVIDSASGMNRVLTADAKDRADLIRDMWAPMAGMYHFIPGGVDMATVHQQNFGFRPDSAIEQVREGLESLVAADAWTRIEKALEDGVAALTSADPGVTIPDLNVLLVLGDPTSQHFVDEVQGMSGFGGISGYIAITVWPTSRVLDRLEAIAVHELHHNVRYSPGGIVWDPQTVMVGEHVVSEGLADVFASELYGDAGYTHFVRDETHSDDQVLAKVASGLGVTGMADFAAWVLGDSSAQLFGAEPVGLPTGAGYAAGARLVRAYLDATGTTAAQNVRTPASEILRIALPRLGLTTDPAH